MASTGLPFNLSSAPSTSSTTSSSWGSCTSPFSSQSSSVRARSRISFGVSSVPASTPSFSFGSSSSQTPFLFPPASTPASSPLFSGAASSTSTSSPFGATASTPPAPRPLFGAAASTPPASSPLFGAASSTTPASSSLFGANAASTTPASSPFFGPSTASSPPSAGFTSAFSLNAPSFSSTTSTTTSTTASTSLFGSTPAASLFGSPTPSSNLFGSASSNLFGSTPGSSSSLFGANAASTTPASSPLFGPSTASSFPSVRFTSAFSLNAPSSSSTTSTTSTTTSTTASTSLFGSTPAASLFGSPTPSSNLFVMNSFSMVEARGIYQFKINHSETKDMGIGERITSQKFRVGQHNWSIKYFPRGSKSNDNDQYMSVFLELQRESVDVRATFEFALLNKDGTLSSIQKELSHKFTSREIDWGFPQFLERTKLEEISVKDSYFVLNVKITVKDESCTGASWKNSSIGFLHERLQMFREENKHTDVSFDVDGKIFVAHRLILAAHSPVFEAEHFGSMVESNMNCVKINEMMPSVFKAMLDFMYNDSLSGIEELDDCEDSISSTTFLQYLLVAADRYAVQKLKAACENTLVKSISLDTVLSTLELAEKHNCSELKKDCLRFVVDKDNFVSLGLTDGYIKLMQNYPSLMVELKDLVGK